MERPILFSGPMIKAILEGRKVQTRRPIKPVPICTPELEGHQWKVYDGDKPIQVQRAPFVEGMTLWVRETWKPHVQTSVHTPAIYRADYKNEALADAIGKWKPSIHMPRWASRLTLKVTDVRVQRLQDITTEDAIAEGIQKSWHGNEDQWMNYPAGSSAAGWLEPVNSFETLWESINGAGSWDANPFVWAISFELSGNSGRLVKEMDMCQAG